MHNRLAGRDNLIAIQDTVSNKTTVAYTYEGYHHSTGVISCFAG